MQANDDMGITVTNGMVRQEIAGYKAFQIKGEFDPAAYKAMLGQQGMTPVGFEQKVRHDLSLQVLPNAVTGSALTTDADIDAYLRLNDQSRDIRYVSLPAPEIDPASISDKEISDYYKAHKDQYMTPETVTIRYVEVKASDMQTDVTPDEQALQARYEKEKSRFVAPEQRDVAHILVSVPANASPDQQKKALARARDIEKQLHDGADFAQVARKDSDDLGSKRQGGDLGWIEPGMTDKAFEEKAFELPKGKISDPVLSPEGYHIILVKIKPGHTKTLDEVKDQLTRELLGSERERKYNDVAGKLVDLVYQDPNSLQPAAKDLGLEIKTAGPFPRNGGTGIASHPEVVQAAFSDQVLNKGVTSDPITSATTTWWSCTSTSTTSPNPSHWPACATRCARRWSASASIRRPANGPKPCWPGCKKVRSGHRGQGRRAGAQESGWGQAFRPQVVPQADREAVQDASPRQGRSQFGTG